MIIFEQVKVGTRVKNIKSVSFYFGKIGTITSSNEFCFGVKYDNNESQLFHWDDSGPSWFDLIPGYRRATIKDLVPGAKIKGSTYNFLNGKTGIILSIRDAGALESRKYFDIQWDDNATNSRTWLYEPELFTRYFDVLNVSNVCKKRKPRKIIPDIPLDPNLPILEAGYLQDRQRKRFR